MNKARAYRRLRKRQGILSNADHWINSEPEDGSMFGVRFNTIPRFYDSACSSSASKVQGSMELPEIRASTSLPARYRLAERGQKKQAHPVTLQHGHPTPESKLDSVNEPNRVKRKASTAISECSSGLQVNRKIPSTNQYSDNQLTENENGRIVAGLYHQDAYTKFPTASSMRQQLSAACRDEVEKSRELRYSSMSGYRGKVLMDSKYKRTPISLSFDPTRVVRTSQQQQPSITEGTSQLPPSTTTFPRPTKSMLILPKRLQFESSKSPTLKSTSDSRPNTNQSTRPNTINLSDSFPVTKVLSLTSKNLDMYMTTLIKSELSAPSVGPSDRTLSWIIDRQREDRECLRIPEMDEDGPNDDL